jgi:hypothetical protein
MLKTVCASVNFKSLILQHHDVPVMQKYSKILEEATTDRSRDPLAGTMTIQFGAPVSVSGTPRRQARGIPLSVRALDALGLLYEELFHLQLPQQTTSHAKYAIGKIAITTRILSNRDCNIFFRSTSASVMAPGIIQYIVSVPSPSKEDAEDFFVIVERHAQLSEDAPLNPFSSHIGFGASLWSSKMCPILEAVPVDRVICHSISRPWVNGVILFRALNRVSISCPALVLSAHS